MGGGEDTRATSDQCLVVAGLLSYRAKASRAHLGDLRKHRRNRGGFVLTPLSNQERRTTATICS